MPSYDPEIMKGVSFSEMSSRQKLGLFVLATGAIVVVSGLLNVLGLDIKFMQVTDGMFGSHPTLGKIGLGVGLLVTGRWITGGQFRSAEASSQSDSR